MKRLLLRGFLFLLAAGLALQILPWR